MVNSVVIVGRCGQDPEVKYFESGKVKTTFSVASNRWDPMTKSEVPDWFSIEVWDKLAEFAGEYIKKGRMVGVEGRLNISRWNAPDGERVEKYFIRVTSLKLLGGKREEAA